MTFQERQSYTGKASVSKGPSGEGPQCSLGVKCAAGCMSAPEEDSYCTHSPML